VVTQIVLTALLSSATTAGALYLLWRGVLVPDLERRARSMAEEATARAAVDLEARARALADVATAKAAADLTAAGEALLPQVRQAIRDGIQDALLFPPSPERLTQTARGMTSAGVNVVESGLRRIFGTPLPREAAGEEDAPRPGA
jgi:hypothetical protein